MDEKYDLIYPRNLARAILGEEPEVYPDDFEASIQYCLYCLDNLQRRVLVNRYKNHLSFNEVANKLEISETQAEYVESVALRKLSLPELSRYIKYGVNTVSKYGNGAYYTFSRDDVLNLPADEKMNLPIDELWLSVRAYNAIRRANINVVSELINKVNDNSITAIKNCGPRTLKNIVKAVCDFGLRDRLTIDVDSILGDEDHV